MEFSKFFQLNTSFSKGDKSFEANSACKNSEGSFIHGSITFKQVGITVDGCGLKAPHVRLKAHKNPSILLQTLVFLHDQLLSLIIQLFIMLTFRNFFIE